MSTSMYGQPGCQVCGCETRHVVAGTYEDYCGATCQAIGDSTIADRDPLFPSSEDIDRMIAADRMAWTKFYVDVLRPVERSFER